MSVFFSVLFSKRNECIFEMKIYSLLFNFKMIDNLISNLTNKNLD